jgi:hypothetical protein
MARLGYGLILSPLNVEDFYSQLCSSPILGLAKWQGHELWGHHSLPDMYGILIRTEGWKFLFSEQP